MATRKKKTEVEENPFINPAREIIHEPFEDEVEKSFLQYSYSVIYDRAIPDVNDGLLPVQRAILWSMYNSRYYPSHAFVKSARIIGEVIGKYHPHGDSAAYGSMVRMTQPFSVRVPLVAPHGNFGGQPGDGAAAARYTEARLSEEAMLLLEGIEEDAVDMRDNYDATEVMPTVLPAQFPNLLVNGSAGIAVGMATKIPTHNPREVTQAARWLLTHPNMGVEQLMEKFVPGPDFTNGGEVVGVDGIREAYETGRGIFRIRGRYRVEDMGRGKSRVVFYELPYGVSPEAVIISVKKEIDKGNLASIADMKDLTDRHNGTMLVFETKAGFNAEALALELFSKTALETSFGMNMTVLVNGQPMTVGILPVLREFLAFRKGVVARRTAFQLAKKERREHLVDGLLRVLLDIDAAIAIIRKSADTDVAKSGLMKKFKLDEEQADYVLSLQLRRLTRFDNVALKDEAKGLKAEIKELKTILADEGKLTEVVGKELDAVIRKFSGEEFDRQTVIVDGDLQEHLAAAKEAVSTVSTEVEDAPCVVNILASGAVIRSSDALKVSRRGKVDPVVSAVSSTTRSRVVLVTSKGRGFRIDALHVGESKTTARALDISLQAGERFVAVAKAEAAEGEAGLALGTRKGVVKVSTTDFPLRSDEFPVMSVADGDEIVAGQWVADAANTDFVFVSSDGSLLRFEASKVRPQGSKGGGMAGIKLADGAHVLGFFVVAGAERDTASVVTFTGASLKHSWFAEFPVKGRATSGVRSHTAKKTLGEAFGPEFLDAALVAAGPLVVDGEGKAVELPAIAKRDASGAPTGSGFELGASGWTA